MNNEFPPGFVPAGEPTNDIGAAIQQAQAIQQVNTAPAQQAAPSDPGQAPVEQPVVTQAQPTNSTVPEPAQLDFADFDDATLARALGVASSGKLTSPAELQSLFEAKQQKELLEATVADLTAKTKVNPFVNPVVQKVNDLYAKGATQAEVEHFIRLQSVDTSKIDQVSAVRLAVQTEYPEFDAAMVDAYLSDTLGLQNYIEGDPSELTPRDRVAMSKAHRDAVSKIESLKVKSETPASFEAQAQAAQVQQQQLKAFGTLAESVAKSNQAIAFDIEGLGDYKFNVPQEFIAAATHELAKMGLQGQWSLDEAGMPKAQAIFKSMVGATYLDQIITSAVKHAESVATMKAKREVTGPAPAVGNRLPGTQAPPPKNANGGWNEHAPPAEFFTRNW